MNSAQSDRTLLLPGFPIRISTDITPAFGSPWLFVDRYVLHRLPVPRHPPCALLSLTSPPPSSRSAAFLSRSNHARITFGFFLFSQNYSCYPISFAFTFVSSSLSSFQGSRVGSPPLLLYRSFLRYNQWWAQMDSNHRPHAYQACALTT